VGVRWRAIANAVIEKAPDSKLAREIAELVRDTETPLLFSTGL
jgi:hypothetical protein